MSGDDVPVSAVENDALPSLDGAIDERAPADAAGRLVAQDAGLEPDSEPELVR